MKSRTIFGLVCGFAGFILGAVLFHTSSVNANPQEEKHGGILRVHAVDTSWSTGKFINGNVVGFSCAPGTKYSECFVLTQQ
jgi:hypothetical protein